MCVLNPTELLGGNVLLTSSKCSDLPKSWTSSVKARGTSYKASNTRLHASVIRLSRKHSLFLHGPKKINKKSPLASSTCLYFNLQQRSSPGSQRGIEEWCLRHRKSTGDGEWDAAEWETRRGGGRTNNFKCTNEIETTIWHEVQTCPQRDRERKKRRTRTRERKKAIELTWKAFIKLMR